MRRRPQDLLSLHLTGGGATAWNDLRALADERQRPVLVAERRHEPDDDEHPRRGAGNHARVRPRSPVALDELLQGAREREGGRGLWLALDCLQDPHNVGAIFRTAAFYGAQGIILTRDRSAPLSGAAHDAAAGGLEIVPYAQPANLAQSIRSAQEAGLWVLGSSERGEKTPAEVPRDRPWLLVIGGEEQGMRQLTERHCDLVVCLAPCGPLATLNASVAAGVLMAALQGVS